MNYRNINWKLFYQEDLYIAENNKLAKSFYFQVSGILVYQKLKTSNLSDVKFS